MGLLARSRGQAFDALPFAAVLRRYGIDANDWDAFRALPPHEPAPGVALLRPVDLLDRASDLPRYYRWQSMLSEEAKKMVPESTLEGTIKLRDTTRPDTLAGAAIYSAAMYKNFPISLLMVYGRLALTLEGSRWLPSCYLSIARIGFQQTNHCSE